MTNSTTSTTRKQADTSSGQTSTTSGQTSIKIQAMSLVSKSIYFSRVFLCFICFDVIIRQRLKKSSSSLNFFCKSRG